MEDGYATVRREPLEKITHFFTFIAGIVLGVLSLVCPLGEVKVMGSIVAVWTLAAVIYNWPRRGMPNLKKRWEIYRTEVSFNQVVLYVIGRFIPAILIFITAFYGVVLHFTEWGPIIAKGSTELVFGSTLAFLLFILLGIAALYIWINSIWFPDGPEHLAR